ncbi:MAG: hypothetical protein GY714_08350 [Desulfobacterales bacterium]|nr:hypothetical protein [Desulfobacterales bacterium]
MKKIILIALVSVLCFGTAYASKFEVTGNALMKGEYRSGYELDPDANSKSFYDFDFNIFPKFVVDENNFAFAKIAMKDIKPGADRSTTVAATTGDNVGGNVNEEDENISVERAYFQTKIGPASLTFGLMDGRAWGTGFGDSTAGVWRVKAVVTTPIGAVVAVHEKSNENSDVTANADKNSSLNGDDNDIYYLGLITKAGPLYIKPLFVRANYNSTYAYAPAWTNLGDMEKTAYILALNGSFGDISIEAEFGYQDIEWQTPNRDTLDYDVYGAYLHASMKMGESTAGFMFLYGGTTMNKAGSTYGYAFGDDVCFLNILDDDMEVGRTDSTYAGAGGLTIYAAYFSMQVMDGLTITPKVGYVLSNYADDASTQDVGATEYSKTHPADSVDTAWEIDIDCAYKINDAVTYTFGASYASLDMIDGIADADAPDDIILLQHQIKIVF